MAIRRRWPLALKMPRLKPYVAGNFLAMVDDARTVALQGDSAVGHWWSMGLEGYSVLACRDTRGFDTLQMGTAPWARRTSRE